MIKKEYGYVNGNTVTSPQRRSVESDKKRLEELERSKRKKNKRRFEEQKGIRKAAVQIACVIFVVGVVIISRDLKVYSMQKQVSDLNSEIKRVADENEALKVDLLKVGNIENIKTQAEQRLGMVVATKDNRIEVEVPKNYLNDEESNEQADKSGNETLLSKLMDALK